MDQGKHARGVSLRSYRVHPQNVREQSDTICTRGSLSGDAAAFTRGRCGAEVYFIDHILTQQGATEVYCAVVKKRAEHK